MEKSDAKVILCRTKYEDALENLEVYHPRYIADMTSVFLKCQELETVKLQFFKAFLIALHRTLNVTQNPKYVQAFYSSKTFSVFFFPFQLSVFILTL